jgi:hypothetical protein
MKAEVKSEMKCGSMVELCVDAHAIPAGCYTYAGKEGDYLLFSIGRDVLFGVAEVHWKPFLRIVSGTSRRRTSTEEFLRNYSERLESLQPAPFDPDTFTFCALSPSASLAYRKSQRREGRQRLAA